MTRNLQVILNTLFACALCTGVSAEFAVTIQNPTVYKWHLMHSSVHCASFPKRYDAQVMRLARNTELSRVSTQLLAHGLDDDLSSLLQSLH